MAEIPKDLMYTEEHEYVKPDGAGVVAIGITDYAQGELGDIVYIELPKVGTTFSNSSTWPNQASPGCQVFMITRPIVMATETLTKQMRSSLAP